MALSHHTLLRVSRFLELGTIALALTALVFRATVYWRMPPLSGATYGRGDVLDFALAALLFVLAFVTAASGLLLARGLPGKQLGIAYRPLVVGVTTFSAYFFVHPYIPQLW